MDSFAFNVWIENKLIDVVFHQVSRRQSVADALDDVKRSLVNHDGYSSDIRVTWPKGQRLTVDSFELRGNYGHGHGEECLCAEETRKEARERFKEYRENDHLVSGLRIVKVRERKGE